MIDQAKSDAMAALNGTDISRNVWVLSDCESTYGDALVRIKTPGPEKFDTTKLDLGKNSGPTGSPRVISRAKFPSWSCTLKIKFNAGAFTQEEILNMLVLCGQADGYGGKRYGKGHENGGYEACDKPAAKVHTLKFEKIKKAS